MERNKEKVLSYDYIRGLAEGEGSFTFSTTTRKSADGKIKRFKIPAFSISMHERDESLLLKVRDALELSNKVYNYQQSNKDGYKRGRKAFLIVRDLGSLKNVIIPLFYNELVGHKRVQFNDWLERIGSDPLVPESYKLLSRLHENGFYAKNPKFHDKQFT